MLEEVIERMLGIEGVGGERVAAEGACVGWGGNYGSQIRK